MDIPGTSGTSNYQQWAHVVECPICYNIYDKPMQMGCGHTLCSTCIGRLVDQVKTNMAEELGRPRGPLLHPDDIGPGFGGLGGFADQEDQPHFIDLPRLDPRMNPNDPNMVRGIVVLPRRGPEARATEIKCPECRKPTLVPADGLPVNYRVQEIVQKVAPLFKDRHLVKLCNQCEAVLSQGVYFDCSQCEETGRKICSTCAIRLHNGHQLVEKKALTSDDVREMKQKISDASHAAFQSLENLKPRLQSVGGTIEAKALDKLTSLIKIFEFMLSTFDSKIKENSTMDELMEEVKKAEKISKVYSEAGGRVDVMLTAIESAFNSYWDPFEKLKQEMGFQIDEPTGSVNQIPASEGGAERVNEVAAPAAGRPIPQNARNLRGALNHFAQVARNRNRQARGVQQQQDLPFLPPPPPHQLVMPPPAMPPPQHMQAQRLWGGPQPQRMNQPMMAQVGGRPGQYIMGHPPPMHHQMQQGPPRMMYMHQQHHPMHQVEDQMQRQHQRMQQPNMNNIMHGNMQIAFQQHMHNNANVPMPPQMPAHPQQQQQQRHPNEGQQFQQGPPPPPPQRIQNHQQQMQQYHQQLQVQQQQQPQPRAQPFRPPIQQQQQLQQIDLQAMNDRQFQQLADEIVAEDQMVQNAVDPAAPADIPRADWEEIQVAQRGAGDFGINFHPEPIVEEVEEEQPEVDQQVVVNGQVVENYRAGDINNVIHFEEVPVVLEPDVDGNVDHNNGILENNVEEQEQFDDVPPQINNFVEFDDMREQVDAIEDEEFEPVLHRAAIEFQEAADQDALEQDVRERNLLDHEAENEEEDDGDLPYEEEDDEEEEVHVRNSVVRRRVQRPRDAAHISEVETRRSARRLARNSNNPTDEPSTSSGAAGPSNRPPHSPTPPPGNKRRRVDRKPKTEEPEQMETEPVDPVHRAPKRRGTSAASSSSNGMPSSSAPTTRSQTRL